MTKTKNSGISFSEFIQFAVVITILLIASIIFLRLFNKKHLGYEQKEQEQTQRTELNPQLDFSLKNNNLIVKESKNSSKYIANIDLSKFLNIYKAGEGLELSNNKFALRSSGVKAGTYGGVNKIPILTIDSYGRVTYAYEIPINVPQVPDFHLDASFNPSTFTLQINDNNLDLSSLHDEVNANFDTANNVLTINNQNIDLSFLKDVYTAGNGLILSNNEFAIDAPSGCGFNKQLIWNGSQFVCNDINLSKIHDQNDDTFIDTDHLGDNNIYFNTHGTERLRIDDSGYVFIGNSNNQDLNNLSGVSGFLFDPIKLGLRLGSAASNRWASSNIGQYSFSIGQNNYNRASYSFVVGQGNSVRGLEFNLLGDNNNIGSNNKTVVIVGNNNDLSSSDVVRSLVVGSSNSPSYLTDSFVVGSHNYVSGSRSLYVGYGLSGGGVNSLNVGMGNRNDGSNSMAIGSYVNVDMGNSIAIGDHTVARSDNTFVFGAYSQAWAKTSFVVGYNAWSDSYLEAVFGRFNLTADDLGANWHDGYWFANEPLFVIGNGTVSQHANAVTVLKNGNVGIGKNAYNPTHLLQVGGAGDGTNAIANSWQTFSDRRWKTNIKPIDNALDKLNQINGVYFNWKNTGKRSIGFIAQDVQKVLPEIVNKDSNGYLSLDYSKVTALLVNAVKEQEHNVVQNKINLTNLRGVVQNNNKVLSQVSFNTLTKLINWLQNIANNFVKVADSQLQFINPVVFVKSVIFDNHPIYNAYDIAGTFKVNPGRYEVIIPFTKSFSKVPVIIVSPDNSYKIKYKIITVSNKQAVIQIENLDSVAHVVNWALISSLKQNKVIINPVNKVDSQSSDDISNNQPTTSVTPTITATPTPSITSTVTPTPISSQTRTPTPVN